MKLRINEPELKRNNIICRIMNMANVICNGGFIPTDHDVLHLEKGRFWHIDERDKNKYHILPVFNDHWAYTENENYDYIEMHFKFRYDIERKKENAFIILISTFFDNIEIIN